jgi:multidrug resistance protein, MATE family
MLDIRYGSILKVALPLMLSGFIQSILSMTDAGFLARYDTLAYDASGSASLWYMTLHMAFIGMADGAQILMARHIGEQNPKAVARVFQSAFFNYILIAVLLTLIIHLVVPTLMHQLVSNKQLVAAELSFLKIRGYAFWASIVTMAVQSTYLATGRTTVVLISAAIVAGSNILFAWLFVFGIGPFPEMGLEGAALASTIAEVLGMLFLVANLLGGQLKTMYPFWKEWLVTPSQLREHVKVGFPLLLQGIVALSVWTVFFIWIEQMGSTELTVSLNIRYLYFLAFVPIWGFSGATKTYIAQFVGAKDYAALPVIQRRIQLLTAGFLVLTFHGAVLYPEKLIWLVNDDPLYIEESARILRIVSGSILIYGLSSVYFQTISGSGNTRVTFVVECMCTFLYLLAAFLLIKVWKAPVHLVWLVEYVYFISMGAFSLAYLTFFKWHPEQEA